MIEKLFEYPSEEYYRFGNGAIISDEEINKWIKTSIKNIKKQILDYPSNSSYHSNIASGNVRVSIDAYRQSEDGKYTVHVNVSKGYEQQTELDIEF